MKIELEDMQERKAKIVLSEANPTLANALRRVVIADVPKLAIEDVEFHLGTIGSETEDKEYESSTPLFDEIIAHRLGLIPIPTDLELFNYRDECEECGGEGCPNCTVIYSLNKKGPCTVYSGDLNPVGESNLRVVDDLIPIVKLTDEQALLIYATAELGTAKDHAKWQPTSGVGYKYYPEIEVDMDKCDTCGECIDICPQDIFEEKDGKIKLNDIESCTMCNSCIEECEPGAIEVNGREDKFIFRYETDGSLTAEQVLKEGLKVLQGKLDHFIELVEDIE
ncbi:MAG: DNA-directed RNA polymerase subunit D [Thermoplasmatota archaeon]